MKYRRKGTDVDAFQYDGDLIDSHGEYYVPDWAVKAYEEHKLVYLSRDKDAPPELYWQSNDSYSPILVGDYIVKDSDGYIIPYKEKIFNLLYEAIKE
jgi:hypothetical protein